MKPPKLLTIGLIAIGLCGCQAPPTGFEQHVFEVKTNYIDQIVLKTNTVTMTNQITVVTTNEQNQIVFRTNEVIFPRYDLITVTQRVETYDLVQGTNAAAYKQTAGAIGNLIAPGIGGPLATAAAGLILTVWGWVRSSRKAGQMTATAANTAQVVEVMREFLKTLPNGEQYDGVLTQWMQQHQADAGVFEQVLELLKNDVSAPEAKDVVQQLQTALNALKPKA